MATLEIRDVTKRFGALGVLSAVDLSVDDGEFLVLVGPSGCGKSTLLNIIAGLLPESRGQILIDGADVTALEPKERDIAMVFQSYALYPSMSVAENMAFPLKMRGFAKADRDRRVEEAARLLQIEPLLRRKPGQLSGGQRQRVAMGRAVVRDPKVFLFDEPLSNLDAKLRVEMRTEIKKLHQRLGTTIVYVTHDQVEAMTLATRIAVMRDGVVQQFDTPDAIYSRPANTFVATFMGSPAMNLIPATVGADEASLTLTSGESLPAPTGAGRLPAGRAVQLGLRPEWFRESLSDGEPQLTCTIGVLEPTGPDLYATVHFGDVEVIVRFPVPSTLAPGQRIALVPALDQAVVFDAETGAALAAGAPHAEAAQ
jgi:multiple sugar transport system ATP-binding protein